jgi:hypothetical protein
MESMDPTRRLVELQWAVYCARQRIEVRLPVRVDVLDADTSGERKPEVCSAAHRADTERLSRRR